MRRNDLTGTGQVFRFTLVQYLKNRTTVISMIVMTLVSVISMLAASYMMAPGTAAVDAGYSVNVMSMSEYLNAESGTSFEAGFAVSYVYGVVLLMLVLLSSGYIIRSVVEEKATRLVETLILAISPMALITGKILACMCLMLIQIALMLLGGGAAAFISKEFLGGAGAAGLFSAAGPFSALAEADILSLGAVIVSVILGYMVFAEVAAISAACCDRTEDMSGATAAVLLPAMAGYLLGCVAPVFQGNAAVVMSVLPVAGIFIGPAKYLTGDVGFGILAVSWAVQAAAAVALVIFGKRVYGGLIIHRGRKVSFKRLMRMARRGGGA